MIDISVALGWLNVLGNSSHLNNEVRRLIRDALPFARSDEHVRRLVERLGIVAQSSKDPLEKAEILLHCSAIGYWRGWFLQSAFYANQAVVTCDKDDHRRAVALWILGKAQWEIFQNHQAYINWDAARKIFQKRQIAFQHFPEERDWYGKTIWQMNVECAARPEEIMTWLNRFECSSLRWTSQQVVRRVQEKIRQRAYPNIYALMQDFYEANRQSSEGYERAEIHLEFALALYQLRIIRPTIEFLREAVAKYYSGIGSYHKQVVARCMLGAVEWKQTSSHKQAFVNWTRCIEEFEDLRAWADRDHLPEKEYWYAEHRAKLKVALSEYLPRPYQDLLFLVQNDADEANRFIASELDQFPEDNLSKLIERAIERVLLGRK